MACLKNAGWFPGPGARPTQARGSPGVGACEETERSKRQIGARLLCTFASVSPSSGSPPAQPSRQSRRVDRPRRGAAAVQWRRQWRCDPSQRRQKANLAPSLSLSLCAAVTHGRTRALSRRRVWPASADGSGRFLSRPRCLVSSLSSGP
jgi:hypothetical protein